MYLFSEVSGVVTMNGKVVENAIIKQSVKVAWNSKLIQQETKSRKDGIFSFPMITMHDALAQILPHEPEIDQKITIQYQGVSYKAWSYFKYDYYDRSELGGLPDINIICELTTKPDNFIYSGPVPKEIYYSNTSNSAHGICRFK